MSNNINSAFLNVLHNKGLKSITEIAEITGLDQATVSRHVHRKQPLNQNHIEVYSKKLKVPKGKFVDDEIPSYLIVGYIDQQTGIVTARGEEDAQKAIFHNEYAKLEGAKVIYDKTGDHILRYRQTNTSPDNTYCFVRTKELIFAGYIGFVTNVTKKSCNVIAVGGKTYTVKDYKEIYPIESTHNILHNKGVVQIIEF